MANNNIELENQLQIVDQAIEFLSNISLEHMRHILDHYIALQQGLNSQIIDYNRRHRDSNVALALKVPRSRGHKLEHG